MRQPEHRGALASLRARYENIFQSNLLGADAILLRSRGGASAPKAIWGPICLVGLPALVRLVLVVGVLPRNIEIPQNCAFHEISPRLLGADGPRLPYRVCANLPPSCPLQPRHLSDATPELDPYIQVPPLRKSGSYCLVKSAPSVRRSRLVRLCNSEQTRRRAKCHAQSSSGIGGSVLVAVSWTHQTDSKGLSQRETRHFRFSGRNCDAG
jgi:hypothetical protein